jgi:glycosyltransferase involved in cell wall biosynthesis
MCAAFALALHKARNVPVTYWAMDINPDQIVATGKLSATSAPVRAFDLMNRSILDTAACVIALDRFMAERLQKKAAIRGELVVLPPWPHVEASDEILEHEHNTFRLEHGLQDKFVVMYSGNLSPVHPITTILEVAKQLQGRQDIVFLFVGGGLGKLEIERFVSEHSLPNVRTLPYQPMSMLRHSLSAADVHLVSMGNDMVGIVHPCKVYGAMAVGRPVIVLGPHECHLSEIVLGHQIGIQISHGDVSGAAQRVAGLASTASSELRDMGARARNVVADNYSKARLCGALCDAIERT